MRYVKPGLMTRSWALLARDPASRASLDNPRAVASLLRALYEAGDDNAVTTLAARAVRATSLENPRAVASLLWALRAVRADNALTTLAARVANEVSLGYRRAVAELLRALRMAGADDAVTTLAARAANAGMFDLFLQVCADEASRYLYGREPDGTPSQPWEWQTPAN